MRYNGDYLDKFLLILYNIKKRSQIQINERNTGLKLVDYCKKTGDPWKQFELTNATTHFTEYGAVM